MEDISFVDESFHRSIYARCNAELGDVLLTKDGANTGQVTINTFDEPISLLSSVCLIKPDHSKLDPRYLVYYIQSPDGFKNITGQMTGAAIKRIILKRVRASLVPLPPLDEQRRIVAVLDETFAAIDRASSLSEENFAEVQRLRASLVNSFIFAADKRSTWPSQPLGDVVEVLDRFRKPITKGDRKRGDIPYYGATGVVDYVDGYIFDEPLVLLGEDGAKWSAGERSAFAIEGKTWVNNHAHVLRPNRSEVRDDFLIAVLNAMDLMPWVSGMTVPKLNQGNLNQIPIPLPPIAVQDEILDSLTRGFERIEKLSLNFRQTTLDLEGLRQSVLHKAFG